MRFSETLIEQIKTAITISSIIGMRVSWNQKKSIPAKGDYWACCPFHEEKTPSFHVQDKTGRYHCFGCHAKGDIFTFIMQTEGLTFNQTVEKLAHIAHIPIQKKSQKQNYAENQRKKNKNAILETLEITTQFFEENLKKINSDHIRNYLEKRNITPETQKQFRLGYATDKNKRDLINELSKKGISTEIMQKAGLIITGDDIPVPYDRFRNRLIFPIINQNYVIAFGARALNPNANAKYINSPQTEIFNKSEILYNLDQAKKNAFQTKQIIIVEGYMDVIAMHKAGIHNAIAPLGTAMTETHLQNIWKIVPEPVICFDGDQAGIRAAYRIAQNALPILKPGHSVTFAILPQGKDPDDIIQQGGAQEIQNYIHNTIPLTKMIWNLCFKNADLSIPERAAHAENQIRTLLNTIKHDTIKHYYIRAIEEKLYQIKKPKYPINTQKYQQYKSQYYKTPRYSNPSHSYIPQSWKTKMPPGNNMIRHANLKPWERREQIMLGIIHAHPFLINEYCEEISDIIFQNKTLQQIKQKIINTAINNQTIDTNHLNTHLMQDSKTIKNIQKMALESGNTYLKKETPKETVKQIWENLYAQYFKYTKLNQELKNAEKQFNQNPSERNFNKIRLIQNTIDTINTKNLNEHKNTDDKGKITVTA